MVSFKVAKMRFSLPSLRFYHYVSYDAYDPNSGTGTDVRKSLAGLDYTPLRRVTWASFNMGILISMGGFM